MIIVVLTSLHALYRGETVDPFVQGWDPYCYMQMASDIREARAAEKVPNYFHNDEETRYLVDNLKQSNVPMDQWKELVGPLGYHYFSGNDKVGPQYPPGAGWTLSLFPRANAIQALNIFTVVSVAAGGLLFIGWCASRGWALSCLAAAVAIHPFISIIAWINRTSDSVNATIYPLFFGTLLAWFGLNAIKNWGAGMLCFASGLFFGLVAQDRVASILLIPSMIPLFLPRRVVLMWAFLAGTGIFGVLPILLHDKLITGSVFESTYDTNDKCQSFQCFWSNINYYWSLAGWTAIYEVTVILIGLVIFCGYVAMTSGLSTLGWQSLVKKKLGLLIAPFLTFVIGIGFFCTHNVNEPYYLTPTLLLVDLQLLFVFISVERHWHQTVAEFRPRPIFCTVAALLAIAGGFTSYWQDGRDAFDACPFIFHPPVPDAVQLELPKELLDKRAWIYTGTYAGSIVYYTGHPAFNLPFGSPEARQVVYNLMKKRGDPQYFITDSTVVEDIIKELEAKGGRKQLIGHLRDAACYRVVW